MQMTMIQALRSAMDGKQTGGLTGDLEAIHLGGVADVERKPVGGEHGGDGRPRDIGQDRYLPPSRSAARSDAASSISSA